MVEASIKRGSLCLMLDGEHKGRIGVCVDISPEETEMKGYNFIFSDSNEYFFDTKKIVLFTNSLL